MCGVLCLLDVGGGVIVCCVRRVGVLVVVLGC